MLIIMTGINELGTPIAMEQDEVLNFEELTQRLRKFNRDHEAVRIILDIALDENS